MKIAYIFRNNMASTFQLNSMILPQLENKSHGVNVVGMMFFDDNLHVLAKGNEYGERLSKVAKEQNIFPTYHMEVVNAIDNLKNPMVFMLHL